jgi:alkylation response protein AidB-like acyl-CoA dehydrogenase
MARRPSVDLLPSPDQLDMVATVERYAERELARSAIHERLKAGVPDPAGAWTGAAALGMFALGLPEEAGGADCPVVEEALVFRVLGRQLAPVGFLGSVLGARLAHGAGDKELRDAIVAGTQTVAVAFPAGTDLLVTGPADADHVLLADGEPTLVTGHLDGVAVDSLDPSTPLHRVPAARISTRISGDVGPLGTILVAALLTGIAETARDLAVGYAGERVQFGRPIGANQSIKHLCADMAVNCEAASSLLAFAALALRDGRPDRTFQVAAAKRVATAAAIDNARTAIQIHGGMGFTWEHDCHLLLTRAHLLDQLFGSVRSQQRTLIQTRPSVP